MSRLETTDSQDTEPDDGQLAASERDFAEGRVHSNADALRQLREHAESVAGPRGERAR